MYSVRIGIGKFGTLKEAQSFEQFLRVVVGIQIQLTAEDAGKLSEIKIHKNKNK